MPEVFPMIPASSKALWLLGGVGVLLLAMTLLMAGLAWSTRNVNFELSPAGLRIRGDLFGRTIPGSALMASEARAIDLSVAHEYRPKWRTMGTGLPGYQAGWFRLQNGEKALLFVTRGDRVVYVPTREGYSVLLSVEEPTAFLDALARNTSG
jgi:hypothetical protein